MQVKMLFSDSFLTKFAQATDLFEDFKVAVRPIVDVEVVDDFGTIHVTTILERLKDEPYDLVAIFDSKRVYYRDPKIKVISDGQSWGLLDDILPK